ncbi:MAG: hypothetical protein IT457_24225 [Planctomycetes bacterium]|nr:hypothetical protein [Planctomycetota bacterium]
MESDSPVRGAVPTLAIQAWPFTDALLAGLDAALRSLKALGFDELEIAGNRGSEPQEFAAAAKRAGLAILGSHEPCLCLESLESDLEHLIARLEIFGCTYATLSSCSPGKPRRKDRDEYRRDAETICRTAERLAAHGKRLSFHPYTRDLIPIDGRGDESGLDLMLRECPLLEVEMDLYFLQKSCARGGSGIENAYRRYSDRTTLCHVRNVGQDQRETTLAPGGPLRLEEWLIAASTRVTHFILEFDPNAVDGSTAVDFAQAGRANWLKIVRQS